MATFQNQKRKKKLQFYDTKTHAKKMSKQFLINIDFINI